MEWPQKYFEIVYKIVRLQNEKLLHEISVLENIPLKELRNDFLPSQKALKQFIKEKINKQ